MSLMRADGLQELGRGYGLLRVYLPRHADLIKIAREKLN